MVAPEATGHRRRGLEGVWDAWCRVTAAVRGRPGSKPMAKSDPADLASQCLAEMIGTALLIVVGLSVVIFDLGHGSPLARVVPSTTARRAITGFLFGTTGMSIALSPVGRVSGAHINPVVTLTFWYERSLTGLGALLYMVSQCVGAVLGALPLLAWGDWGRSLSFGATEPGPGGVGEAFAGEVITTFFLIGLLVVFVGSPRLRRFTPGIFPPLYCIMVWLEAPWSGTSTNPARSLGPDVIALATHSYWLYWVAPLVGTAIALAGRRWLPLLRDMEIDIARVAHFDEPLGRSRG